MADEKLELVTENADPQKVAEDMARSISKMYEDMDAKIENARQSLLNKLDVESQKYLTANGVMNSLLYVRDVYEKDTLNLKEELELARKAAVYASDIARSISVRVSNANPWDFDNLLDEFYDNIFAVGDVDPKELINELVVLRLCQNIGYDIGDVKDFYDRAGEEIEKARQNLREFCTDNDIDFNELCGPHEDCYDCLCYECVKDCKEDKQIKDSQSAYDVCKDFEAKEE